VNTRLLRNSGIQQWRSKKMRIMLVASIGFYHPVLNEDNI
jgi:hypothetical protein